MTQVPASDSKLRLVADQLFAKPGGHPLCADLYLPVEQSAPAPVVVWIHGGGWRLGDRKLGPDLRRLFATPGFAWVSIDYRLSGQAVFPAQLEDVKTGIRWLRSVASQYQLDAQRIGLLGSSSGGHLAALAALTSGKQMGDEPKDYGAFSDAVQAVVDGYGPTDFLQIDNHRIQSLETADDVESQRLQRGRLSSDADSFESLLVGGPIHSRKELVQLANPVAYASAVVPFLILHGTMDSRVPTHQSILLYEALAKAGADATLCQIDGLNHGFLNENDFGKDGPHRALVKHAMPGQVEACSELDDIGFDFIEEFFLRHLVHR